MFVASSYDEHTISIFKDISLTSPFTTLQNVLVIIFRRTSRHGACHSYPRRADRCQIRPRLPAMADIHRKNTASNDSLTLTIARLEKFQYIATPRRKLVKYIWLRINLQEYDCLDCEVPETELMWNTNSDIITAALDDAFRKLSIWSSGEDHSFAQTISCGTKILRGGRQGVGIQNITTSTPHVVVRHAHSIHPRRQTPCLPLLATPHPIPSSPLQFPTLQPYPLP
jgi:hypothetical protein